jgi:hypothetical protein
MGIEAKNSGELGVVWGTQAVSSGAATFPVFTGGTAISLTLLQDSGGGGQWNFNTPLDSNFIIFKGSGGGGGGGGSDFVPRFKSTTEYTVPSTNGRRVRLNEKYYEITEDLDFNFTLAPDDIYYIYVDTDEAAGEINDLNKALYIKETTLDPNDSSFPDTYAVIGQYVVSGGAVSQSSLEPYSTRELDTELGDFVPSFDETEIIFKSTNDRKVLFNNDYYSIDTEVRVAYNTGVDGLWYIYLDTNKAGGTADSTYFVLTQFAPDSALLDPHYVPLGEYNVSGGSVDTTSELGYSVRSEVTWVYGIPNIRRASDQKLASGSFGLIHGFSETPDVVTYKYWDDSAGKFYNYSRTDIETSVDSSSISYVIPAADPNITFDAGDYFEVEAFYYAYTNSGGFASPKSDYTTGWYTSTPPSVINHSLFARPQNITLEFSDGGVYYVEDGNQFVDKNSGGITSSDVTFDWTALTVLSVSKQMRIHMNVSKVSAGSFTADKDELGVVKVTGNQPVAFSPDLILDSTNTNFATTVNSAGNNISVLVKESITISLEQDITATGVTFNMLPGTYIISETVMTSMVKFSGDDYEIENIRLISKEDITSGLKLDADGIVKNLLVKQDASTKTLTNAVEVTTGNVATVDGRSKEVNGTITNKISDVDGLSEIRMS